MSVNTVIDILRQHQVSGYTLNMESVQFCIAAKCLAHLGYKDKNDIPMWNIEEAFEIVSGISDKEIIDKVIYKGFGANYEQAIRMLEILRDEGVVNWNRAKFKYHPTNILKKIQFWKKR